MPILREKPKEGKIRFKSRTTEGILASIQQKDKNHKEMIKEKKPQTKQLNFSLCKMYLNIIVDLLEKRKEIAKKKKKNCEAIWKWISEVIYFKSKAKAWKPNCLPINSRAVNQSEDNAEYLSD